jgi:putative DNA primase/helicase
MTDHFDPFNPHHAHERAALEERAKRERGAAERKKLNGGKGQAHKAMHAGIEVINGVEIMPRPIDWIWNGYLARGKLHVLAGAKGAGKTTIAIDVAAAFTTGRRLPDGSKAPIGDVLMWSGEDDVADSLLPRLIASGGDRSRINFICGFREGNGKRRAFDPGRDFPSLIEATRSLPDLVLINIDPIVSAVAGDSHKNAETRRGLQPVIDLLSITNAAGLGLTHFTKGTAGRDPVDRITGSLAFGAVPRVLFGAAKPADPETKRRFVRVASNIGPDGGGFEYVLRQELLPDFNFEAQRVVWGTQLDGDARTLLREIEDEGDSAATSGKMKEARAWLCDALASGPVAVVELEVDAKAEGIAWRTIKRAKRANAIVATKDGEAGSWRWRLPE